MKIASILKKVLWGAIGLILVLVLLAGSGWVLRYRLLALYLGLSQPVYSGMVTEEDVMVPMRDRVRLATDIYRPDAPGLFPAVMMRLPYGKNSAREIRKGRFAFSPASLFTQRGYALVMQDTRGRYASEGDFYAFSHEAKDGEDTLKWLREQPWFNGELGTAGASYFGYTQWALAPAAGNMLKCMAPMAISADLRSLFYRNGAVALMSGGGWATGVGEREDGDHGNLDEKKGLWHLPLMEADDAAGADVDFYNDWLTHYTRDAYWEALDMRKGFPEITAPALLISGWYDLAVGNQLADYEILRKTGGSEAARRPRLVVGPWVHGSETGDVDYGKDGGLMTLFPELFGWYDYWLRGVGELPEKPVRVFVMGINQWREEDDWPLARAEYRPFYIHSQGAANTTAGSGVLDETPCAANETPDVFTYDPANPVPTKGGCFLGPDPGARNQKEVEGRDDVLVYTSAPLTSPLEVTGPIRFVLHAATSCNDTDFTAKLCDVYPDGMSINLAEGIIRGRFREEGREVPLAPGEVHRFEIDLWATSNAFLQGHRIRVQVSSSSFPQFDRSLNVYGPFAQQSEFVKASQTVYHDAERPSHILLPVIPD